MLVHAVGHEAPRRRMAETRRRGRLASTYLFIGPEGIGKRCFALELAAALLCHRASPSSLEACGRCESCALFGAGTHPDLLLVSKPEGKSGLPLELFLGPPDKRNQSGLCHDIALKPMLGSRRIAIIDDADDLGIESANCLLKTLEEPPPGSLLILLGTSLGRQLPTIRSRSQVVRFQPLDVDQVLEVLTSPSLGLDPTEAKALAESSGGSVTRALDRSDDALQGARRAVRECLAAPRIDPLRLAKVLEDQSKASGTEPRLRRRLLREMIATAVEQYRQVLRQSVAEGQPAETALRRLEACLAAEEALARNANQSALVAWLANRLWRPEGLPQPRS